jgi:hypothetical protein
VLGDQETGGRAALPIFREIMLRIYRDELVGPVPEFPPAIEGRTRLEEEPDPEPHDHPHGDGRGEPLFARPSHR